MRVEYPTPESTPVSTPRSAAPARPDRKRRAHETARPRVPRALRALRRRARRARRGPRAGARGGPHLFRKKRGTRAGSWQTYRFEEMLSRARTHTHSHTHHTDYVLRRGVGPVAAPGCGESRHGGRAGVPPPRDGGGRALSSRGRGRSREPVSLVQACLDLRRCRGAEIDISTAHHAAAALASALACFSAAFVRELAALSPCFLAEAEAAWLGLGLELGSGSGLGSGLGSVVRARVSGQG